MEICRNIVNNLWKYSENILEIGRTLVAIWFKFMDFFENPSGILKTITVGHVNWIPSKKTIKRIFVGFLRILQEVLSCGCNQNERSCSC